MSYVVALAPDLGITADEFPAAWNADADCVSAARAELHYESGGKFVDPAVAAAGIALVSTIVGGAAKDIIVELVKRKLAANDQAKSATVTPVDNGPAVIIVVVRDGKD